MWEELTERQASALARLREPFPEDAVELRPVYVGEYDRNDAGDRFIPPEAYHVCPRCGKRHPLPAKHLSYIGHAAVTKRLNDIDPSWSWRAMASRPDGAPLIIAGGLWIYLTVCGVERIGYGDADGKLGDDVTKEVIGDAIRNAAMRFGCGLEMWMRDDEEVTLPPMAEDGRVPFSPHLGSKATKAQRKLADTIAAIHDLGAYDGNDIARAVFDEFGQHYYRMNEPTVEAALNFIDEAFPLPDPQCECQLPLPADDVEVIRI